jgi:hypothetical protein
MPAAFKSVILILLFAIGFKVFTMWAIARVEKAEALKHEYYEPQGISYRTPTIEATEEEPTPELIEAMRPIIEKDRAFVDTLDGEERATYEELYVKKYGKYLKYYRV